MADQGSRGGRLPLALPPAPQGSSTAGAGGSAAGGSGNPPPPRSLQGLLQMAITAGSEEPDPPPEPMSEEVRGGRGRVFAEGWGYHPCWEDRGEGLRVLQGGVVDRSLEPPGQPSWVQEATFWGFVSRRAEPPSPALGCDLGA